ncbi:hypothetical protein N7520_002030 [Penicillium odoratum]|uniref:uncharacterized protein n=1 Tax=Penicillium odoratum TaxID=1167516 RepID=UPI0025482758|nr:uncharacterized protein N7520_002030 [Penicillium odoratum]KAJ5778784.1 hypothetical protein N7520_002030 [Penicillium odoratum]
MSHSIPFEAQLKDFDQIFSLSGKVAVVTGSSRGLGLSAASGLLQAGCAKVYITARNVQACEDAAEALNTLPQRYMGAEAIAVPADLSSTTGLNHLVTQVSQTTDHIDIIVSNAGTAHVAPFATHLESGFSNVLDLNLKSVFYLIQKFTPMLQKNATQGDPSRIIINASIWGLSVHNVAEMGAYSYAASKAAVIHLSEALAVELGPRCILCNTIAPGWFPSDMASPVLEARGGKDQFARATPNRRLGQPEDIAGIVVFLASRAASHLNGAMIRADGGGMFVDGGL